LLPRIPKSVLIDSTTLGDRFGPFAPGLADVFRTGWHVSNGRRAEVVSICKAHGRRPARTLFGRKLQCPRGIHPNGCFAIVQFLERDVSLRGLVDAISVEQLLYLVSLICFNH
jgi:hypothetical protein